MYSHRKEETSYKMPGTKFVKIEQVMDIIYDDMENHWSKVYFRYDGFIIDLKKIKSMLESKLRCTSVGIIDKCPDLTYREFTEGYLFISQETVEEMLCYVSKEYHQINNPVPFKIRYEAVMEEKQKNIFFTQHPLSNVNRLFVESFDDF